MIWRLLKNCMFHGLLGGAKLHAPARSLYVLWSLTFSEFSRKASNTSLHLGNLAIPQLQHNTICVRKSMTCQLEVRKLKSGQEMTATWRVMMCRAIWRRILYLAYLDLFLVKRLPVAKKNANFWEEVPIQMCQQVIWRIPTTFMKFPRKSRFSWNSERFWAVKMQIDRISKDLPSLQRNPSKIALDMWINLQCKDTTQHSH